VKKFGAAIDAQSNCYEEEKNQEKKEEKRYIYLRK